ncbi:hypothetical protein IAU59_004582 [Kwoniella sp. CBS 9459]
MPQQTTESDSAFITRYFRSPLPPNPPRSGDERMPAQDANTGASYHDRSVRPGEDVQAKSQQRLERSHGETSGLCYSSMSVAETVPHSTAGLASSTFRPVGFTSEAEAHGSQPDAKVHGTRTSEDPTNLLTSPAIRFDGGTSTHTTPLGSPYSTNTAWMVAKEEKGGSGPAPSPLLPWFQSSAPSQSGFPGTHDKWGNASNSRSQSPAARNEGDSSLEPRRLRGSTFNRSDKPDQSFGTIGEGRPCSGRNSDQCSVYFRAASQRQANRCHDNRRLFRVEYGWRVGLVN